MQIYQGHVHKEGMTDEFAEAVADCIGKGVLFLKEIPLAGGSPKGKRKAIEATDEA